MSRVTNTETGRVTSTENGQGYKKQKSAVLQTLNMGRPTNTKWAGLQKLNGQGNKY
jgi:hypothetical protein